MILWDLASDMLTPGQWIRAHVHQRRCDLSPDGRLFAAFVARHAGPYGTWTTLSRPPFFTALALWPKGDSWGGGGVFESAERFGLAHGFPPSVATPTQSDKTPAAARDRFGRRRAEKRTKDEIEARRHAKKAKRADAATPRGAAAVEAGLAPGFRLPAGFEAVPLEEFADYRRGEDVWMTRMRRDGWAWTPGGPHVWDRRGPVQLVIEAPHVWRRRVARDRVLALRGHGYFERNGRGQVETGAIEDEAGVVLRELGRVDFLDFDHHGDALWGWEGKLWRLNACDLCAGPTLIADLNAMTPQAAPPPDWALAWP